MRVGDLDNVWVLHERRAIPLTYNRIAPSACRTLARRLWRRTERRVRGEQNALLVAVLLEHVLRETGVQLDLVVRWDNLDVWEQSLESLYAEIGDADGLDFTYDEK